MKLSATIITRLAMVVCALCLCIGEAAAQQGRKIGGIVVDENSQPLIGATIRVEGNDNKGAVTDYNGEFTMTLTPNETALVVSYLGYKNTPVNVTNGTTFRVEMESADAQLEQITIAYGSVRKADMSGSVSVLAVDEKVGEAPIANLAQYMQGRVSGVQIRQNSGEPGASLSIQIRGAATISGDTTPLYVVDGVAIDDIDMINPQDVESMQILKDASATAIYGSRGTNGVVIITTKQGQAGKAKVTYSYRLDISSVAKTYDVLNAYDYALYVNELDRTSGGYNADGSLNAATSNTTYSDLQLENFKIYSTDWQDLMYGTGVAHAHQVNISGGSKESTYNIGAFYNDQTGIINSSGLVSYGFRLNHNWNVNKKLRITSRINLTDATTDFISHSDDTASSVVYNILMSKPTTMPEDVVEDDEVLIEQLASDNPYKLVQNKDDVQEKSLLGTNFSVNYKIGGGFSATVNANYNKLSQARYQYYSRDTSTGSLYDGQAQYAYVFQDKYTFESLFKYAKTLNKVHRVDALVGWTYDYKDRKTSSITVTGFPNDDLSYNSLGSGTDVSSKSSSVQKTKLSSFLSRVNYTFDDRFIFTVTGRYDGSSLLSVGNQWDFFPSAAFAWRVTEEDWMKSQTLISNLKLKASYGITGSQSISYAAPLATMTTSNYTIGTGITTGMAVSSMANELLTWETTNQANIGFEMSLDKGRYNISADYYNRVTSNLLYDQKLAPSSGYSTASVNCGEILNQGFEFEVSADVLRGPVSVNIGGNITLDRNKVLDLGDSTMEGPLYLAAGGVLNQSIHLTQEGYAVGSFYGYIIDGLYQNAEEVAQAPTDESCTATPGSYKFVDISGADGVPDGVIDSYDMTIIGNRQPDFNYGFYVDATWKRLSVNVLFQGSEGGVVANMNKFKLDSFTTGHNISSDAYKNSWTSEGSNNFYAVIDGSKSTYYGSRFTTNCLEDASYLRLKNVTISYMLPVDKISFLSSVKVYMSATNLFTLTGYSGYDPEAADSSTPYSQGVDYSIYPLSRTISFGLNVGF